MIIHGVHSEIILAAVYALFLAGIAATLEFLARHAHRRSEQYRNAGFAYKHHIDVWECPTGQHLTRTETDLERRVARYRAPAHICNACHCKANCTDSDEGRVLESRPDSWLESELRRFHRGISLSLLLLAVLILAAEMIRYRGFRDWLVLLALLIPLGVTGSRHFASFAEPARRN